jgi:predicted Zn-dependent peptidase
MTLVLQSRLLDAIRQELGGTYVITATPDADKFPRPQYSVRIEWTCDPARTASLVQRVFEEIAFVKDTLLSPDQVANMREGLLREYESNSQDNGYLLNQISRRYEDRDEAAIAAGDDVPTQIQTLTGRAIQRAARTYLNTENYVKVTRMPETK